MEAENLMDWLLYEWYGMVLIVLCLKSFVYCVLHFAAELRLNRDLIQHSVQSFTGLAGHGPSDTHVGSQHTYTALLLCCPAQPLCHPTRDTFTLPLCMPPLTSTTLLETPSHFHSACHP